LRNYLVKRFEETGSVHNRPPPGRRQTMRTCNNIAAVNDSVEQNRTLLIYRRSQQLDINETSVCRIMHEDILYLVFKSVWIEDYLPETNT